MIKKLVYLFLLLGFVSQAQVITVDRFTQFASAFTAYPNASNPNPELITNDAAALDPAENVNAINLTGENPFNATRTSVASDSGYCDFAREIEATSGGSLRRDRLEINGILTNGEVYQLNVLHKCDDTTQNVRDRVAQGGTSDNQHPAHTDWELHVYEFTATGVNFEYNQYVRATSVTGQKTTYNISLKLKDD